MTRCRRIPWLAGLVLVAALPCLAAGDADTEAPTPPDRPPLRETRDGALREAGRVAALIERLDAVRGSGDVLPVHAVDLELRRAVERELLGGDPRRDRAQRVQIAERIGSAEDATKRDEAYRTPVEAWADPRNEPSPGRRKAAASSKSTLDEADFERRLRAVVYELSQLDGVLDDAGLDARRDLLVQLLQLARARAAAPDSREATAD